MRLLRLGLVFGLALTAAACGDDDTSSTTPTTTATTSATTSGSITTATATTEPGPPPTSPAEPPTVTEPPPTTEPQSSAVTTESPLTTEPAMVNVKVYFVRGERLAITHREIAGPAVLGSALTELLEGPSMAERDGGMATTIPEDTVLLDVNLAAGTATVDLSDEYESGGGSLMMMARIAQVVFTATQFDNVDEVVFRMEGEPIEYLGGEGILLDEPQTRSSTARSLTGGILVDMPASGATVTGPIVVTGEGDVYEGDFPIVVRRDGVDVAGPFIVPAGAWGAWADFEATILLDLEPGPIELVAWDESGCGPPDCPPSTEIVIPLTLT